MQRDSTGDTPCPEVSDHLKGLYRAALDYCEDEELMRKGAGPLRKYASVFSKAGHDFSNIRFDPIRFRFDPPIRYLYCFSSTR